MRRRDFLGLAVGAAANWPTAVVAQGEKVRRVGILMSTAPSNHDSQARLAALQKGLEDAGWSVGQNLRIETSWADDITTRLRKGALDLVGSGVDVLVGGVGPTPQALQSATRMVPIVMAQSVDPVGAGLVARLSRPGGNTTGFMQFEYGLSGKWPELLRELNPQIKRIGVVRDSESGTTSVVGTGQWAVIQSVVSPLGGELTPINLRNPGDAEHGIAEFAREQNGGLVIVVGSVVTSQYQAIVDAAAKNRIPAVYPYRFYVEAGGLLSYGPDLSDLYRRAAGYVDRILKGEKPGDLPVQAPTKYHLAINLKTAKTLGISVPTSLLARADDVIE